MMIAGIGIVTVILFIVFVIRQKQVDSIRYKQWLDWHENFSAPGYTHIDIQKVYGAGTHVEHPISDIVQPIEVMESEEPGSWEFMHLNPGIRYEDICNGELTGADIEVVPVHRTIPVLPKWFTDSWTGVLPISPAEQLIINELNKYPVYWEREVSFHDLRLPTGGYPRYDFLLLEYGLIIEYDGKNWHSTPEKIATDNIKTQYCTDNNIEIVRYNSKHYYKMEYEIRELMYQLGVIK